MPSTMPGPHSHAGAEGKHASPSPKPCSCTALLTGQQTSFLTPGALQMAHVKKHLRAHSPRAQRTGLQGFCLQGCCQPLQIAACTPAGRHYMRIYLYPSSAPLEIPLCDRYSSHSVKSEDRETKSPAPSLKCAVLKGASLL